MDVLTAADELKAVDHSSIRVVDAWWNRSPGALTDALTEPETELIRIESEEA